MSGTLENSAKIAPAEHAFPITPADGVDLIAPTRGVYVGTAGDLRVRMVDGGDIMLINLAAGIIHPIRVIQVWAAGTTADDIRGLRQIVMSKTGIGIGISEALLDEPVIAGPLPEGCDGLGDQLMDKTSLVFLMDDNGDCLIDF